MKLNRFNKNEKTKNIIIISLIVVIGILIAVDFIKSHAYFETGKTYNVLEGRIPNFSGGDVTLAVIVDGKKEDTFPDKKVHKYVGYVCNNDDVVLTWDNDNWRVTVTTNEPTVCTLKFETKTIDTFADYLKSTGDLVTFTHEDTEQTGSNTNIDYRYTGAAPNNYVKFNNELWRIIGIFNTDDGMGNYEERVKLIRNESIGNMAWDTNNTNDWTKASLQKYLNGEYYNNLNKDTKNQIGISKWYLGTSGSFERTTIVHFLNERNNNGFGNYICNIGLMYSSDYGFATSGDCLSLYLSENSGNDYSQDKCKSNNWLYSNVFEWVLSPYADGYVNNIWPTGTLNAGYGGNMATSEIEKEIRPVVYLKANVVLANELGIGSKDNPYEISIE